MSDRRLRGHPTMVAKYDAEGREKPIDRFESPRAVPLHYREHSDARVVIGPDGYPALHHEALDLITAGAARDPSTPRPRSWLTVAEVARILELDEHIIRRAIARGAFRPSNPPGRAASTASAPRASKRTSTPPATPTSRSGSGPAPGPPGWPKALHETPDTPRTPATAARALTL